MKDETSPRAPVWLLSVLLTVLGCATAGGQTLAEGNVTAVSGYYRVDPFWPRPLPHDWVTGEVGGTCVDKNDHVFIASRTADEDNLSRKEKAVGRPAPPLIEFDPEGNVVHSWGDFDTVPLGIHDCYVDFEGNIWVGGNQDAVVQKYSQDGELLLEIGVKGEFDTDDGTIRGTPNNSGRDRLNRPAGIAVDPDNGDVYIADGYGNRRVVVFDREGRYLRQFGRQATEAETRNMKGGVFTEVVHHIIMSNDGLLYVCDREGRRVQVFDKQGRFKQNIVVPRRRADLPGNAKPYWTVLSRDPAQKYLIVAAGEDEAIWIVERGTGEVLEGFGNMGHMAGEFTYLHSLAIDSKGNLFVGETIGGRRAQKLERVRPLP